ncbi:hypothetical protein PSECIP111854_00640 [Pseudoalteromonas sp. CIP111854]|uniref:Uncharacterized protein n=1 Tax=Pseudoalteromonas holothuriae TaxID=2963714 RepID=A0A9W4VRT5_9GAMM|nr:hypothetical protein [Pseudoalteromonas sp. CIP111854]CAH9050968.1 hypothetical protein PSECIP111854_00640 [Pseudoalteromonas sp. CIP111854]
MDEEDIKLNFINRSNDFNNSEVVVFQSPVECDPQDEAKIDLMEQLKEISKTISALEKLQPKVQTVISEQQEQGIYNPSISVDDDFESVVDMLNKLHENLKSTI